MTTTNPTLQTLHDMLSEFIVKQEQVNADTQDFIKEQRQFKDRVDGFIEKQEQFNKDTSKVLSGISNDLGDVKGAYARSEVLRETSLIASDMGYRFFKNLSRNRIKEIADKAVGFDPDELESFRRADVIMEADKFDRGGRHYIAVEVSYTVQENDVRKAIRNAQYLRKLTDRDALAAVAGVDIVPAAKKSVDAGDVYWYEVPARDIKPE